jgi:hypothetical protein
MPQKGRGNWRRRATQCTAWTHAWWWWQLAGARGQSAPAHGRHGARFFHAETRVQCPVRACSAGLQAVLRTRRAGWQAGLTSWPPFTRAPPGRARQAAPQQRNRSGGGLACASRPLHTAAEARCPGGVTRDCVKDGSVERIRLVSRHGPRRRSGVRAGTWPATCPRAPPPPAATFSPGRGKREQR